MPQYPRLAVGRAEYEYLTKAALAVAAAAHHDGHQFGGEAKRWEVGEGAEQYYQPKIAWTVV